MYEKAGKVYQMGLMFHENLLEKKIDNCNVGLNVEKELYYASTYAAKAVQLYIALKVVSCFNYEFSSVTITF